MCGIYFGFSADGWADRTLRDLSLLQRRGPDAKSEFSDDKVVAKHFRLAIRGEQGAHDLKVGNSILLFNGELISYNEQLLVGNDFEHLKELVARQSYESLWDFQGFWSFVLFDRDQNRIIFGRDPYGVKPLFTRVEAGSVEFSSIASVIGSHICEKSLLMREMFGASPLELSGFEFVQRVEPGSIFSYCLNSKVVSVLSSFKANDRANLRENASRKSSIRRLLNRSILHNHLTGAKSCVLGSWEGVDSEIIRQVLVSNGVEYKNLAYDQGVFRLSSYDKRRTDLVISLDLEKAKEGFLKINHSGNYDGFNFFTAGLTLKELGRKTCLTGIGADEIFDGYRKSLIFNLLFVLARIPFSRWFFYLSGVILSPVSPKMERLKWARYSACWAYFVVRGKHGPGHYDDKKRSIILEQFEKFRSWGVDRFYKGPQTCRSLFFRLELCFYLEPQVLEACDHFLGYNGVEGRVPFLHTDFLARSARSRFWRFGLNKPELINEFPFASVLARAKKKKLGFEVG